MVDNLPTINPPNSPSSSESETLSRLTDEIKKVIVGQDQMVERLIAALLAKGHVLLEGLPGVAKTLAISTLADCVGAKFVRIQFTPDLLPSDLLGTRIWKNSSESFDIDWGPVFSNFVLADEINRAPAKVQSALLEVMAEKQVSIGGVTAQLPRPFIVLATQNPIESEGVYALPSAQQDRFMMKVLVPYPTDAEEFQIVNRMAIKPPDTDRILDLRTLEQLQIAASQVHVEPTVVKYAVDLVVATREPARFGLIELTPLIEHGVSPRATLALVAGARSLALMRGRNCADAQDVFDIARDVLRHRLELTYEALAKGTSIEDVLNRILATVPAANVDTPTDI